MLRIDTRGTVDEIPTDLLYMAVVDPEFRDTIKDDPGRFNLGQQLDMPETILPPDRTFFDVVTDDLDSIEILACVSTCSKGPFTIICDGTTKSD